MSASRGRLDLSNTLKVLDGSREEGLVLCSRHDHAMSSNNVATQPDFGPQPAGAALLTVPAGTHLAIAGCHADVNRNQIPKFRCVAGKGVC